jgi:hypothetical protein
MSLFALALLLWLLAAWACPVRCRFGYLTGGPLRHR